MIQLKALLITVVYFLLLANLATAQNTLTDEEKKQIEQLFESFQNGDNPGLSFGLMKDGKIIYTRNAGLSNLVEKKLITSQTSFQLGEMSRHFTAYAALLLEYEGLLDLDRSVASYLPDLDLPSKIKVLDLLRQSSGLNNFHTVKTLAGWYHLRPYDQTDALSFIQLQDTPRYEPGTDFNYSVSNLILLKEVIEAVSGEDFPTYMKEKIFNSLGMDNTVYLTENNPLSDIAIGYELENDEYQPVSLNNHTLGNQNLYSSVEDLLIWEWHLMNPPADKSDFIRKLKSVITLPSGREFSIPQGKVTMGQQFTHKERGIKSDYLASRMGPYTSAMFNFPDHGLIGVVLSNNNMPYNGYLVMNSAYIILKDEFTEPMIAQFKTEGAPVYTPKELEKYTGSYYDKDFALVRNIELVDDTLRYARPNSIGTPLISVGSNKFQLMVQSDDKIIIEFPSQKDEHIMYYTVGEAETISFSKFSPPTLSDLELGKYSGTFVSKELGIAYDIKVENNQLFITNPINGTSSLSPISNDVSTCDAYFIRSIRFHKDVNNGIDGFYVRHFDAWDIHFEKITTDKVKAKS